MAEERPTAVTIASEEEAVAARVQALLSTPRFRCYRTTDVQGAAFFPPAGVCLCAALRAMPGAASLSASDHLLRPAGHLWQAGSWTPCRRASDIAISQVTPRRGRPRLQRGTGRRANKMLAHMGSA